MTPPQTYLILINDGTLALAVGAALEDRLSEDGHNAVALVPATRGTAFGDADYQRYRAAGRLGPEARTPMVVALHEDGLLDGLESLGLAAYVGVPEDQDWRIVQWDDHVGAMMLPIATPRDLVEAVAENTPWSLAPETEAAASRRRWALPNGSVSRKAAIAGIAAAPLLAIGIPWAASAQQVPSTNPLGPPLSPLPPGMSITSGPILPPAMPGTGMGTGNGTGGFFPTQGAGNPVPSGPVQGVSPAFRGQPQSLNESTDTQNAFAQADPSELAQADAAQGTNTDLNQPEADSSTTTTQDNGGSSQADPPPATTQDNGDGNQDASGSATTQDNGGDASDTGGGASQADPPPATTQDNGDGNQGASGSTTTQDNGGSASDTGGADGNGPTIQDNGTQPQAQSEDSTDPAQGQDTSNTDPAQAQDTSNTESAQGQDTSNTESQGGGNTASQGGGNTTSNGGGTTGMSLQANTTSNGGGNTNFSSGGGNTGVSASSGGGNTGGFTSGGGGSSGS
jgi:hypothetical protein